MVGENTDKEMTRILVVDDVEANRFTLRDIITDMGYQAILTENGQQALKILARFPIQLIISDIAMPVMDGYELCKQIKSNPETREIPMIFISAFDDPEDIVKGFALEGEDYITKPFIPEVVRARVQVHLKLYEATRGLQEINRQLQVSVDEQIKQIETEKKNVLYALLRVAREYASYDEDHMHRLAYNCRILAEAMQLSNQYEHMISDGFIETIELAAPLCDLGNVAIPTQILQKDTSLSKEEEKIVQTHAEIGARVLRDIKKNGDYNDFLQMSIDIANYHHENWDGSGYPEGIKGDDIPLSAQIVAVVSEYCALTEKRTYRDRYDKEDTFEIMKQDIGVKFNPDLYEILRKIYRQLQ